MESTIEEVQVERVNIETSIEVVVEEVARGVNVGAGVGWELHLGVVCEGTVLHALRKPQELSDTIFGLPLWHLRMVPVTDVEDSPIIVHFSPRRSREIDAFAAGD